MNLERSIQVDKASQSNATQSKGVLRHKCSCGQHTSAGAECSACNKKLLNFRRWTTIQPELFEVPSIVYEELRSSGQPLDPITRGFMEQHLSQSLTDVPINSATVNLVSRDLSIGKPGSIYEKEADRVADAIPDSSPNLCQSVRGSRVRSSGLDFTKVRIHTGMKAAESTRAINAQAYAVGNEIVFGTNQYAPDTQSGRHLLAHELTHVIQQSTNHNSVARVIQRVGECKGRNGFNCNGVRCETAAGRRGTCVWGGLKYGCNCRDNSTDEPAPSRAREMLPSWLLWVLSAAAIAAIGACFASGICEFGIVVAGLGSAAAAAVVAILNAAGIRDSGNGGDTA